MRVYYEKNLSLWLLEKKGLWVWKRVWHRAGKIIGLIKIFFILLEKRFKSAKRNL